MWYIVLAVILVLLYYLGTKNYDYWDKKNVPYEKPIPFVGSFYDVFTRKVSSTEKLVNMYNKFPNSQMVGGFVGSRPTLTILDPKIISQILVTDFAYFYARGFQPHKKVIEPMMQNLFFADGDLWKLLRQRLTPAFTSGKLKAMFPLIIERTEHLKKIAAKSVGKEIDVRDLMARYTIDFIGACGFGIDASALDDEDSMFKRLGKRVFTFTFMDSFKAFLKMVFPETFKHLNFLAPEISDRVVLIVKSIMSERNYKPVGRNDFIDQLLELKQKGKITVESVEKRKFDGTPELVSLELDDLLMAAQVLVFFTAGFETSSSATSYTLNQLAFNPEVQILVQKNIDEVLAKFDNKLSYDAIKEMSYLDWTFREGMRMFPSLGFLKRECAKKYKIPGTDVTIDPGVSVTIPLQALHNDEKYFDSPQEFRPSRFNPECFRKLEKHVYMPFGEGPRACIGERLGLMQSLAGLAAVLTEFDVVPSENSQRFPKVDPTSNITQSVIGGIPLTLLPRNKSC